MWTLPYTTYQRKDTGNFYFIDPEKGNQFVFTTLWGNQLPTTASLYEAESGKLVYRINSRVAWYHYDASSDLLFERRTGDYIKALRWRSEKEFLAPPVWNISLGRRYNSVTFARGQIFAYGENDGNVQAIHYTNGKVLWTVPTGASNIKSATILASNDFWYYTYTKSGKNDYLELRVEKRSLQDGSLVWVKGNVTFVKYGWFGSSLSENGNLLYLWPTSSTWFAAIEVN